MLVYVSHKQISNVFQVSDHAVDSGILDKTTIKKEIDKKLKKLKYL